MQDSDFAAAVAAVQEERDDDAIALFGSFPPLDWLRDGYDWKCDHAEEFSEVIQRLSIILPTDMLTIDDFAALAENYILALVHIPNSIDLAAEAAVAFWNRIPVGDPQPLRDLLTLLRDHPDGERVDEIAATAIGLV